jgi:hypothetical protein
MTQAVKSVPIYKNHPPSCIDESYANAKPMSGLTRDEAAAILVYTAGCGVYRELNKALRNETFEIIEPWFPYLKLLHTALNKLPSVKGAYCRGESTDWIKSYSVGSIVPLVNTFRCAYDFQFSPETMCLMFSRLNYTLIILN